MTIGVVENEEPVLAELIALAFESAGHDCLVLRNLDCTHRVLRTFRVDSIVLDLHMPGRNALDWLETAVDTWPDLPSRTLLLTDSLVTNDEAARVERLGADLALKPLSLLGVDLVVAGHLDNARSKRPATIEFSNRRDGPQRTRPASPERLFQGDSR